MTKLFPVLDTDKKCRPSGYCMCCLQGFDAIEPVGWVVHKGTRCKKYFHARCMALVDKGELDCGQKEPV